MRRLLAALALSVLVPFPVFAGEVTVETGDTLSEIAERHGVGLRELMRLNGIEDADHVEVGDRLKVPGGGSAPVAPSGRVTVKAGDTLSQIAERNGLSVQQLMALNGIDDADHVEVGQTLRIRGGGAGQSQATTSFTYERGAEDHVVRKGESLSAIAKGHDITLERLVALNGIEDPNLVKAGQRLRLTGNPSEAAAPAPTTPEPEAETETETVTEAPKPSPRPQAQAQAQAQAAPVAMATATTTTTWRTYGPMRVDWAQWQPMGGSMVAPVINEAGQPIYLALNCGARKMNATTAEGNWQAWQDPQADFEQKLMTDFCTTQGQ